MAEVEKLTLTCSACGKVFHCKIPSTPGRYSVTCTNPACKAKINFHYPPNRPKEEIKFGLLDDGSYRFRCDNKSCQQSVLVPANMVKSGHNKVTCPKCKTDHEFDIVPAEDELLQCQTLDCNAKLIKPNRGDGIYSCVCHKCGQEYSLVIQGERVVKVTMKTPTPLRSTRQAAMKLVMGRFLGRKEHVLSKGIHYVGRLDEANSSDFSIKDKYASTRSVRIDVNENGGNLVYRLTVERALNPVYHNSRELTIGDVVYLTYGDTLQLGKTRIKVQKVKS